MKKTLRNDLILIISLVFVMVAGLLAVFLTRKKDNLIAKIYVETSLVEQIDLSRSEDKEFYVKGSKGSVKVSIKDHAIAIIESDCPHQDCVHMGYVSKTNTPIICAYNSVYIIIEGNAEYDVKI